MGIGHGFRVYLTMQGIMVLIHSTAVGFGLMVSCMAKRVEVASILGAAVVFPFFCSVVFLLTRGTAGIFCLDPLHLAYQVRI